MQYVARMSRRGDKKSLLRQRCAKGIAQLPALQTKWIFTGMQALGGRWAVKLARHIQKLVEDGTAQWNSHKSLT